MTLTDYKSQLTYTNLYSHALIQVPFVRIWWNPGPFQRIPVPFCWNPEESCGIQQNRCIPAGICRAVKSTASDLQYWTRVSVADEAFSLCTDVQILISSYLYLHRSMDLLIFIFLHSKIHRSLTFANPHIPVSLDP